MTADSTPSVTITGPAAASGTVRVPGDKSISHRALLLAGLSDGQTTITGLSGGGDVRHTAAALAAFGVTVEQSAGAYVVRGGPHREPENPLDHGNSGTGIRLMAGVCAGLDMFTVLTGDQYLRRRPMDRIAAPLRQLGAHIDGRAGGSLAPLAIRGGHLHGITYRPPVASAQVKSAVLLAGLHATGPSTVIEPTPTRRHTEEMLTEFGVDVHTEGTTVTVHPGKLTTPGRVEVPGDPSQSAFWLVAGLICPDSEVTVENLYLGLRRTGFLTALQRMGADLDIDRSAGTVTARTSKLTGIDLTAADIPDMVDEVPVIALAAAFADGTTVITGAGELRVKESDRIATTVAMLTAFGVPAGEQPDGLVVPGGHHPRGGTVDAHGDHRIAMAAAVGALAAGPSTIHGWDSVATSYPGFATTLEHLTRSSVIPA